MARVSQSHRVKFGFLYVRSGIDTKVFQICGNLLERGPPVRVSVPTGLDKTGKRRAADTSLR